MEVLNYFYDVADKTIIWVLVSNKGRCCYVNMQAVAAPPDNYPHNAEDYTPLEEELKEKGFDPARLPYIEDTDPVLVDLYNEITDSENCMWFVEHEYEDDIAPWEKFGISKREYERRIDMEIEKYALEDVIVKNEDEDTLYTCYGDLQNAFSFPYSHEPTIMSKIAPIVGAMVYSPFLAEIKNIGSKVVVMLRNDGLYCYEPTLRTWIKSNDWLAMLLEGKVVKVKS